MFVIRFFQNNFLESGSVKSVDKLKNKFKFVMKRRYGYMTNLKHLILVLMWAFFPGTLLGATIWSIPGGLWSTTSTSGPNCSCTPAASDDIIVDDAGASITSLGDLTGTIDILNGGTLTIDGLTMITPSSLTIRSGGTMNVTVDLKPKETAFVLVENGGTLNVGNRLEITNDAIFVVEGAVNVDGDKMTMKNDASLIVESGGVLDMTDPTSTLDINSVGGTLIVDGTIGTPEEFKLSGGTMGGSGTIIHGGTCSGGGTINGLDDSGYCDAGLMNTIPMSAFTSIFYSFADGDWDDNNSWSFTSDGSSGAVGAGIWPGRYDDVVIRNGHTITVDAVDENNFPGIAPDDLFRSNVGTFTSSNVAMFFHGGDIIVDAGGILDVNTIRSMYEGYFYVNGTFDAAQDIVNLGNLEVTTAATFNTDDNIVLSGSSFTTINNTSTVDDDIYMDHIDALLCGTGIVNIGNGGADPEIQYFNSATEAQICSSLTITCTSNCGVVPFVPPTSQGNFSLGYKGPGGVADTDGSSELILWLDAGKDVYSDAGVTPSLDGGIVQQWGDQSGSGNNATKTSNEPTYDEIQATINGAPAITFTNGNSTRFNLNTITLDPESSSLSIITILNLNDIMDWQGIIQQTNGAGTGRGLFYLENTDKVQSYLGGEPTIPTATYTYGTWAVFTNTYDNISAASTDINLYKDGTAEGTNNVDPEFADGTWLMGCNKNQNAKFLNGQMPEMIIMSKCLNTAERIVIENYLSAKYNTTLASNDVYEQDDNGFDFEVAGIGQDTNGEFNRDAQGTGLVRINLASNLDDNEYLMWGNDGTAISEINTTDVDGAIIEARFDRVWRVSENDNTGAAVDVGTVRLTFDVSNVAPAFIVGSDLRLLITRDDASFADNDVTPQAGSYNIDNQLVTFSNVDLQDGDYFTLGTTDNIASPLPIALVSFTAAAVKDLVALTWITASELNNDFFTIERSREAIEWETVAQINGLGTTNIKNKYSILDERPYFGISYYRLKQTDFDGTFTYSKIVSVLLESTETLSIYPNPSRGSFTIKTGFKLENAKISAIDMRGRYIPLKVTQAKYAADIQIQDSSPGIYILEINDGLSVFKQKVLINY